MKSLGEYVFPYSSLIQCAAEKDKTLKSQYITIGFVSYAPIHCSTVHTNYIIYVQTYTHLNLVYPDRKFKIIIRKPGGYDTDSLCWWLLKKFFRLPVRTSFLLMILPPHTLINLPLIFWYSAVTQGYFVSFNDGAPYASWYSSPISSPQTETPFLC